MENTCGNERIRRMNSKYKNKRGSIQDIFLLAVVIAFFGIVLVVGAKVSDEFNTYVQSSDLIESEGKANAARLNNYYGSVMDNSMLFLMVGLGIAAFIMAALVKVHPIFIPFFIIIFVIIIFLSGALSNVYQEIAATEEMSSVANQMTLTTHILTYLPIIVGVFGTFLMVIMYKSWQGTQ